MLNTRDDQGIPVRRYIDGTVYMVYSKFSNSGRLFYQLHPIKARAKYILGMVKYYEGLYDNLHLLIRKIGFGNRTVVGYKIKYTDILNAPKLDSLLTDKSKVDQW